MSPFLAWDEFTRACVSLALLSLRKNGGLLVVYVETSNSNCSVHSELNFPSAGSLESCNLAEPFFFKYSGDECSGRVY